MKALKVVCVGDLGVGKTNLLISNKIRSFSYEYTPTVMEDNYEVSSTDQKYSVSVCDIGGGESYDRFRLFTYADADAYLVCFSIGSRRSFMGVENWILETAHHNVAPVVLVGTKVDLRANIEVGKLSEEGAITRDEGEALVAKFCSAGFDVAGYVECSSLTG